MAKDIMVKVGEYTDSHGQSKGEWIKAGVILSGQNGDYILLDPAFSPSGALLKQRMLNPQKAGTMVAASIFDNSQQRQQNQARPPAPAPQQGYANRSAPQQDGPAPQGQGGYTSNDDYPF